MAVGEAAAILERMALDDLGLAPQVLQALQKRGHTTDEIRNMSPEERFSEFCEWEGLVNWASQLLSAARSCGVVLNSGAFMVIPVRNVGGDSPRWDQCPEHEAEKWEIYDSDGGEAILLEVAPSRVAADKWIQERRK